MSEKSPTYDSAAVRFSGAVALGMMLTFGNRDIPDPTFALIADANWLRDSGFIVGQRLLLFLLLIFCGIHRSLFLVGALITLTTWIMMYSMVGAFSVALITMALYGYFVLHRPAADRKSVAAIIVSLTFVLAAIQKLNPSYLRGDEFTSLGAFFGFLEYWNLAPYELPEFLRLKVLPIASILVEFAIGFGVLFKPALFSHLALLFTTLLSFIHPSVLYVYATIFPFAVQLDDDWSTWLANSKVSTALQQPFTWTIFATFPNVRLITLTGAAYAIWPVSFILTIHHAWFLRKRLRDLSSDRVPWSLPKIGTGFVPPAFMMACFVAFFLGAPAPIGYSMFSGKRFRSGFQEIRFQDQQTCWTIRTRIKFSSIVDAGFGHYDPNVCWIRFPTESGILGVKRWVCNLAPSARWTNVSRDQQEKSYEDCSSLTGKTDIHPVEQ